MQNTGLSSEPLQLVVGVTVYETELGPQLQAAINACAGSAGYAEHFVGHTPVLVS